MVYKATEKSKAHKQARRLLLIDKAISQVKLGGFTSLTMESLAQEAGIAVGTLYKYFDSKASLCLEVFRVATEKEVTIIDDISKEDGSPNERLGKAITTFSRRAIHSQQQAFALIFEPINPLVEKERLNYRKTYALIFEEMIKEGIESKEFIDQSTHLAATAIVGIIAEVLIRPLSQLESKYAEDQFIEQIKQFCLRSIACPTPQNKHC